MQINAINSVNENLFRYQQNAKENNLNENGFPRPTTIKDQEFLRDN